MGGKRTHSSSGSFDGPGTDTAVVSTIFSKVCVSSVAFVCNLTLCIRSMQNMHVFLELEYGATKAIQTTLDLCEDLEYTVVASSSDKTSIAFDDDMETITGHHSVFLLVSRIAHTMPSDAHAAAMVDMWLEIERDAMTKLVHVPEDKKPTFIASVLRELDTHLAGKDWLIDLDTSSAADFCWISRIVWFQTTFGVSLNDFTNVRRYSRQDPRREVDDKRECALDEEETSSSEEDA